MHFSAKQFNERTVIKNQQKENRENPIIYQYIEKLQNLISGKSVPSFQKLPFADILQSRCS